MTPEINDNCSIQNSNIDGHQTVPQEQNKLLSGTKVDSTTSRVTSTSNPELVVTVKILHPSMLLVD